LIFELCELGILLKPSLGPPQLKESTSLFHTIICEGHLTCSDPLNRLDLKHRLLVVGSISDCLMLSHFTSGMQLHVEPH